MRYSARLSLDSSCLDPFSFASVLVSVRTVSVRRVSVRRVSTRRVSVRTFSVRFVSGRIPPPLGSYRFGTESDLELELVERPARVDCNQLWASRAFSQRELQIQFSSVRIRTPRTTRSTTQ